jgi:hypothetical protein
MNNQSRHVRLHERYRKILIDRTTHPDQPIGRFCRSHKISVWSYYYWKKRIRVDPIPADHQDTQSSFIPIALQPAASLPVSYEIQFANTTTLSVRPGFNRDEVSVLIGLLSSRGV